MNERSRWLNRLASYDFAAAELHIYLETHPDDVNAADALRYYETEGAKLRRAYEEKFGPLSPTNINGNRWAWIADPWPWDTQEG